MLPPQDPDSPTADEAVRRALAELVAAEARARARRPGGRRARGAAQASGEAELARRLERVCATARDAGLPVERVIVLLKEAWTHGADTPLSMRTYDPRLAALVSSCIAAYFRDERGATDERNEREATGGGEG